MMQSSSKKALRDFLQIDYDESFFGGEGWQKRHDNGLQNWIREVLIPTKKCRIMAECRPQLLPLWDLFFEWLDANQRRFKILKIDLKPLSDFGDSLTGFNWSPAAIYLIETILIRIRQQMRREKIADCSPKLYRETFSGRYPFRVPLSDYRKIHQLLIEEGNDYEIVLLELLPFVSAYGHDMASLKGSDILFKRNRAYIQFRHLGTVSVHPLPLRISKALLKLLRSRDILGDEFVFGGQTNTYLMLKKKVEPFLLKENIPLFALQAFENIVRDRLLEMENAYKSSWIGTIGCLLSPRLHDKIVGESLRILDSVFDQIVNSTGKDWYVYNPYIGFVESSRTAI